MKKHALALSLFCIVVASTQAQNMSAGIKGGLNIANVTNSDNADSRISGHAGFFLHGSLAPKWGIQPEFLYSGQGEKYTYLNHDYTLSFSYLQVPVMFQFYPIKQFYLEFGPYLGFLLAAKQKIDDNKSSVYSSFKKVEAGLGLGAGVWATRQLGFYARYDFGLSDITKNDNQDYYNRVAQIGIAIKFQ